ncbi:MAG TPA: nitroreductase family protein [Candidatus Atribacteria bacterium]|nr:nitroreductase family protein [Candidatus Atribacteria bacterium]
MLKDLIKKNRTYRRYDENFEIKRNVLEELVDLARLSASASNRQPLKYILSCEKNKNDLIFPTLAWAGYLKDWPGPAEGERPSAYIVMLNDTEIIKNYWCDPGIAAQSILLGATEKGLGGCIFASVKKDELRSALKIDEKYDILYVLSIGKPKEKVVLETVGADGDIKYWRDSQSVHHVPKRPLEEIIID